MKRDFSWWQEGIIYQVVVRSFLDTNGDGNGDLPGVINKLDYLQWLGVRTVWLTPIYPSPLGDLGYDLTDYTAVHPHFGTLEDVDHLLEAAHNRTMKVVLDWVPNHISWSAWEADGLTAAIETYHQLGEQGGRGHILLSTYLDREGGR
jgi:alpha-glucosidase